MKESKVCSIMTSPVKGERCPVCRACDECEGGCVDLK